MEKSKVTFWNEKVPFIKEMKKFYSKINYKEINLWPVMAPEVYIYYQNPEESRKMKILAFLKYLFTKDRFKVKGDKNKIFASYVMAREDHRKLIKNALKKFNKEDLVWLDAYEYKIKKPLMKFSYYFPDLFLFFKIFLRFRKNKFQNLNGWKKMHFIFRTYFRFQQIKQFHKIYKKFSPKAYIAFCAQAFPEETIFTLICKKNKIPTFTMQHGFILEHFKKFSPNASLLENNVSDYNLIWGAETEKTIQKYSKKVKTLIVGNPKYSFIEKKSNKNFEPKRGSVFLSVLGHGNSNKNFIKILNEFSLKNPKMTFDVKKHPFDDWNNYKEIITSKNINLIEDKEQIPKMLEKSDFVLLHNTSIAMEALLYQIPIMYFSDDNSAFLWENEDRFKNKTELEILFKKLKKEKVLEKWLGLYKKELIKKFYFHPKKEVSEIYYEKIEEAIKNFKN